MKKKSLLIVALSLLLAFGLVMQAAADPIADLTVTDTFQSLISVGAGTNLPLGPYASVDVFVYSTGQASLEFTALNDFFLGDILGANLATPDTAVESSIVFSGPFPNNPPVFTGQSANEPANINALFGDFNLNLAFFDAFGFGFKDVSFLLSGAGYTDASAILAFNADGFDAYAHIFNVDGSITFFAAEPIPLPPTVLLMGSGLLGLGLIGWRRKSLLGK